jgi:hypothetical protein
MRINKFFGLGQILILISIMIFLSQCKSATDNSTINEAELYHSPLKITSGKTAISDQEQLLVIDKNELIMICKRSPYIITRNTDNLSFICDYKGTPVIKTGEFKVFQLSIVNKTYNEKSIALSLHDGPVG